MQLKVITRALVALLVMSLGSALAEEELPKVLIIGDSISMAYTPIVKKELEGKAVVTRNKGNAGPSIRAVKFIDSWLGETEWDVIHFNWGLWDYYGWEYAKEDLSPDAYEKRLEKLVTRLKKTGARLIWGTTTPICPGAEKTMTKRFDSTVVITPELEKKYLDAARRVMEKYEVQINDLHAIPDLRKHAIDDNDVHYVKEGNQMIAEQVAKAIAGSL